MEEFADILHRDYGLKPHGKSAPMTSTAKPSPFSSSSPTSTPAPIHRTSSAPKQKNGSSRNNNRSSNSFFGESLDDDIFFGSSNGFSGTRSTYGSASSDAPATYDDVFGGAPKFTTSSYPPMPSSTSQQDSDSQSYDDIFRMPVKASSSNSTSFNKASSFPVFDAPVYDDDIFGGVPGIRNAGVVYDDVFSGSSTVGTSSSVLEDLLGISENKDRSSRSQQPVFASSTNPAGLSTFDDLLPGFGIPEPANPMPTGADKSSENAYHGLDDNFFGIPPSYSFDVNHGDDPFNVQQSSGQATASQVEGLARSSGSHGRKHSNGDGESRNSSPNPFKPHSPSHEKRHSSEDKISPPIVEPSHTAVAEENSLNRSRSTTSSGSDEPRRESSSPRPPEQSEAPTVGIPSKKGQQALNDVEEPVLPKAAEYRQADEFWISVEDVKLVTEPTATPPPSRRPPLPGVKHGDNGRRAAGGRKESSFKQSSSRHESPRSSKLSSSRGASDTGNRSTMNAPSNPFDELEQFVSGVSKARKETKIDISAPTLNEDILDASAAVSASSMAVNEAMERARSKLRERGKEDRVSGSRTEEIQDDAKVLKAEEEVKVCEAEERQRIRDREEKEREAKALREERDRRRREREKEREIERERERERELKREREREREREKDRIAFERAAVERANAEARERLAAEARQKAAAERAAAEAREQAAATEARERAAVEKVTAEARERAAAEARERAAAEAREKAVAERIAAEKAAAEKAAAEARERAAAEARERVASERAAAEARAKAERAFVERVHAEARERAAEKAAAEARERAAAEVRERAAAERVAAAREQQRRSENDLESFFAASSRPASAPRQRSPVKGTSTDGKQSSKRFSTESPQKASTAASGARKVTPTSNDDFTSLFGPAVPSAGEFQEVEGELAERRRARWERHQRTAERAAKALDEKNQRDLQSQREQAERHRVGEILDLEIKRWAAGKEGNLRALLSTLQYVLWPECGWQAVSLTELITAAAVKKVYRKATLFVHPDKVQQKGATIQQKYIAEKVFDLLKEAWNKFNSEELF